MLWSFWQKLDDEDKEKIIEAIVAAYEWVFRKQYQESQKEAA
jgi:hypothetical protein